MKKYSLAIVCAILLLADSCQKCFDCQQYCAYCIQSGNTGVVVKVCADKDVARYKVDSLYLAYKASGYNCNRLDNEKKVCDNKNKINDATDYYKLQDYYCNPWEN